MRRSLRACRAAETGFGALAMEVAEISGRKGEEKAQALLNGSRI